MGRKNKTKLLKHGSQSLNASTITEADGRSSSNGNRPVEFEALSTQLREFVASGSTPDRHRDMRILFSTLEKRDAELEVAKQLINKLRSGVPADHNGDGDSSLAPNEDEALSDFPQDHNGSNILDELDHLRRQNGDLINLREKLTLQLVSTEENVSGLKDQVNALENKLDHADIVLNEGKQTSATIIDELKQSLKSSDETVQRLTAAIESQRSSYQNTCAELDLEKLRRIEQEEQLTRSIQIEQKNAHGLQQLVLDNEKLESRYESINNGVQLMKKDFDEVKSNLVKSNEQVQELQQQLTSSKADVKHYRDNEDACRKYIKKLEDNIQQAKSSTEKELFELQQQYTSAQQQLQKSADEIAVKTNSEQKLIKELQDAFRTDNITSIFDAVRELRENFKREQHKLVFQSAALEGKDVALQKQIQQNKDLLESIENDNSRKEHEKKLMDEERIKFQEELDQAKLKIKKLNKEKNQTSKRLKNLLAEKSNLLEQNKSLEDKLNQSHGSQSNESVVSDCSDPMDLLEETVKSLKSTLENTEETLSQVSKQLVNKEEETLNLHRTLVAYKSKIDEYENDQVENQKAITTIQSSLVEQQKLFEVQQKQYEADLSGLRQNLESSKADLQVQQEMFAKENLQTNVLKNEHALETKNLEEQIKQLKSTIASLESEKLRVDAAITSSEEDKRKIHEEKNLLEVQISALQEDLSVKDRLEKEKLAMEECLRKEEEENTSLKKSLDQIKAKMAESKLSQEEKEATFVEMNQQLENEVEVLRTQIMKQDVEIEKLSSSLRTSDQAIKDLANTLNQSQLEHEKVLQSEKAKLEILGKKLEEKTTESSEKVRRLKEKEQRMEELKVESEKASQELKETVQRMENEIAQIVSEKAAMNSETEHLKSSIAEKQEEIQNLVKEKLVSASLRQELENEIANINKRLEDAMSPKKDKVLQLENRLEVLQTASKAQHKRLEDELSSVRASLELSSEKAAGLEKQNAELQQQVQQLDEVQSKNISLNEKLEEAVQLKEVVSNLEKQNKDIQLETAEERAGLVNELIDAKQKLVERDQQVQDLEQQCKLMESQNVEVEETISHTGSENQTVLDSMFPSMDPAVRQLVILLSENRNYSYGVLGLVIYGFLVHLYILWY